MKDRISITMLEDGIADVRLIRADKMNALDAAMWSALAEAIDELKAKQGLRVVVLSGEGRAFCAGLDLVDATQGSGIGSDKQAQAVSVNIDLRNTPPTVLHAIDKPVICALNGSAAGYGMDLALGCDIRIMAAEAKLAAAFVKRGVVPESGGTWFLPRMIGWA